ncbi:MAG: hypothetical protein AAFN03_11520 [Pseudomonadota bacterium]
MRRLVLLSALLLVPSAFAQSAPDNITGAWASGESAEACDVAPITLFMSDGVVAVFLSKDGDLHALGSWSATDETLTMTHNDFPLGDDGQSKAPVELTILDLSKTHFLTRNSKGTERARIRCSNIELTLGHGHDGHGNH